jgi:TPR repeat protein
VCELMRVLTRPSAMRTKLTLPALQCAALIFGVMLLSACQNDESLPALERAAQAGDGYAQQQLAYHYLYGVGVDENHEQARQWLELSAAQGLPYSQVHLARLYLEDGDVGLRAKARTLLEAALADDYSEAGLELAKLMATSPDSKREDGARAVELLETSLRADPDPAIEQFEILAAAYARAGRFAEAVGAQRYALADVDCRCKKELLRERERRLAAYLRGDCWNETL